MSIIDGSDRRSFSGSGTIFMPIQEKRSGVLEKSGERVAHHLWPNIPRATIICGSPNPLLLYTIVHILSSIYKMPSLSNIEFESFLDDKSKCIQGDIVWGPDEDHSPTVEFTCDLESDEGFPVVVRGSYNHEAQTLSYTLIYRGVGRVYALDMGKRHRNPDGTIVGDVHKHKWSEPDREKNAYEPQDITAPVSDPQAVWKQFLAESRIDHKGILNSPVPPPDLFS